MELELAGVTIVDGAGSVASHATMIMTSLPNADAANAVAAEIARCGEPARIVIELSTFTIADIAIIAYTRLAHEGGFELSTRPNVQAWVARCENLLSLARWPGT